MSSILLNPSEARVLGCLIEKKLSTPANYPLTLNSLVNACNQSSNRDPVVSYDQHRVNDALVATRNQGLSLRLSKSGSRTAKFDETLTTKLDLSAKQSAVLAELLLRGPQTPGELRQRTTRMVDFPDLEELENILLALSGGDEPLIVKLPKEPGKREARFAHTLCGTPDVDTTPQEVDHERSESTREKVERLEELVEALTKRVETLEGLV